MFRTILDKSATVLLVTVCILIFGTVTYLSLPRESNPDVKVPVVLVTTPYIGVSPADMESLVTVPVENELAGIKDLKTMRSTSAEGVSIVFLEFEPEVVIEEAMQRVRNRVDRARPKLPEDVEETEIKEISFSDMPIMLVTIAGPVDETELKRLGEDLEDEASRLPGVLDTTLTGGLERRIFLQIDPDRLNHYGLSLDDVIGAVANENVNVPGGNVESGSANFLLRVPGEFEDPRQIEGVAIKRKGDVPVFVRDVAKVVDGFADRETYSRMNGQPAVTLSVSKRTGANILDIAEGVKALAKKHSESWPASVSYRILADQSRQIRDMVSDLENNVISAFVLVVAVVLLFMGARNSAFIGLAIPLSMLLSFIFISLFGMTLNMMVLFSLVLALGMLVDNGIVLVENIYRHVEEGSDLRTASIEGAKEVAGAVAASTATTVAAFLPMVFWTGIMGQFMSYLPKTVIIVLLSSLAVAVVVLPVFTARFMRDPRKAASKEGSDEGSDASARPAEHPVGPLMRTYRAFLELSLKHRYIAVFTGTAVLIGTFFAYAELGHGVEFFSETEPNRATIAVRAPDGTALSATDKIVRRVEELIAREENVDVWVAETGVSGTGNPMDMSSGAYHMARITMDFLPDKNMAAEGEKVRIESTTDTIDRIRRELLEIPGAAITVEKERMGPPVGSPIAVEVSGETFHGVGEVAARVRRELAQIEGAVDLTDDYRVGRPELRLRIDRGAAKLVGASTQDVAQTVRTAVAGTKASTMRDGEDEYDIMVELAPRFRENLQNVLALRIPGRKDTSPDTFPVPLSVVADYELVGGSGAIRHIDQDLVVTINGDIAEGHNEAAVRERVEEYLQSSVIPGFQLQQGGANDEQANAQAFLMRAFAIAVFLILFVLIMQFDRFDMPLIILGSVVMSLVGVLWGLVITETPFGIMMTGIGVISLAGVVVNNAIVLLTYVQQLMARGHGMFDALVRAGMARVRPVLLTAITTILGLVPMALGISFDFARGRWLIGTQSAQWWGPMAVAVIFGLAFATLLTLVMVPTMFAVLEDVRGLFRRRPKPQPEPVPEPELAE
ncbi:MAG: efflux RND transporter permease subunit [Myxococcales bacterium]|nr:efflux RND transporter permease subunit [Myxococcales bacterium]